MNTKVLFVDDDPNILSSYQRQFRNMFPMAVAVNGQEGLEKLAQGGPFAVVVSDVRMPEMDGIEFLRRARKNAPNTVRIMLTGNADLQTAVDAVNEDQIFRFLTKPCQPDTLRKAIEAGVEQYRLVTAEAELLEKTLLGSINVLTEMVALTDPEVFSRAKELREHVREVAIATSYPHLWELELAALMSPLGILTVPPEVAKKFREGGVLLPAEQDILNRVPSISHRLLNRIPRLENVARIVLYRDKNWDGSGTPKDKRFGEQIPLGSRILRILSDMVNLEASGTPRSVTFRRMGTKNGFYDPELLDTISRLFMHPIPEGTANSNRSYVRSVKNMSKDVLMTLRPGTSISSAYLPIHFADLVIGDVLAADVLDGQGVRLIAGANTVTEAVLEKLRNYKDLRGILEPVLVTVDLAA